MWTCLIEKLQPIRCRDSYSFCQSRGKMKLLLLFSAIVVGALAEVARFDQYQVRRVLPTNIQHLEMLRDLEKENLFDFWKAPTQLNEPVDMLVPPHQRSEFNEIFQSNGIKYETVIDNVQSLIEQEQSGLSFRAKEMEWTAYHNLEEFDAWMDSLAKKYNNVKKIVIGKTYEKRDIKGIEITFGANLRTVFLESGIHAREWISAAATSWVVNEILKSPADSAWRKFNYIYIPFYNPDGYAYTWSNNRMWRKTRTPYKKGSVTCYGADPNRNWGFHWNEQGCSNDPCSEIYSGPKAFSEVETKTISEYLTANAKAKKIDAYIAFHSYSQLIMYPWAWSPNPTPHSKLWKTIGDAAAKDLAAVNNEIFKVGDVYHVIYPASGSSLEWFYGNYNSTISFIYELRDKGKYGFVLPPQYILPSAKELYASVLRIIIEYTKLPPKF